ncbi:hypothetical protein BCR43DRAFT_481252 [Syncephalastrum racemosum]|uniref:Uncharacterized protein n=1 Tax=Syncephalastrum racemosum TaxID=13706 RepID=A0A1X2HRN9_SYNRA|nr:hypothetical protein BCR43DRAFT_481252 [Syncephalastrum racemosum]
MLPPVLSSEVLYNGPGGAPPGVEFTGRSDQAMPSVSVIIHEQHAHRFRKCGILLFVFCAQSASWVAWACVGSVLCSRHHDGQRRKGDMKEVA